MGYCFNEIRESEKPVELAEGDIDMLAIISAIYHKIVLFFETFVRKFLITINVLILAAAMKTALTLTFLWVLAAKSGVVLDHVNLHDHMLAFAASLAAIPFASVAIGYNIDRLRGLKA